jgi:hypothetical protein
MTKPQEMIQVRTMIAKERANVRKMVEMEETDDEYKCNEPWPANIWNEEAEQLFREQTRAKLNRRNYIDRAARNAVRAKTHKRKALREWDNNIRRSKDLDGPGPMLGSQLFAGGKDVWRFRSNGNHYSFKVKISAQSLKEHRSGLNLGR